MSLISRVNGRIDTLFYSSHDRVSKGDLLAIIQNDNDYRSVLLLERHLGAGEMMVSECMDRSWLDSTYNLSGSLQECYITFQGLCNELRGYMETEPNKSSAFYRQKVWDYNTLIRSEREKLMAHIERWKREYTITAPIEGEVVWAPTRLVAESVVIGSVCPGKECMGRLYGNMEIENANYQKILVGQEVNVLFNSVSGTNNTESVKGIVETLLPLVDKVGCRVVVRLESDIPEVCLDVLTRLGIVQTSAQIVVKEKRLVDLYLPVF